MAPHIEGDGMRTLKITTGTVVAALVATALALAQQPAPPAQRANPAPGCTSPPAQLEANKKVAMEFFRVTGQARVALADPSYRQHNPAFKKRAVDNKVSDYDEFRSTFLAQAAGRQGGAGRGGGAGPLPPPGNPFEIVTAECDLVTLVHRNNRQDPTAAPGTWYEVFTFDTFRVRNGKLVEHWDGAVINPPAQQTPAGGSPQ
jgi:predicted SnoaL-like aldol condensation-catalyzing enzyme